MTTQEYLHDLKIALERMPLDQFFILCFALFLVGLLVAIVTKESLWDKDNWIAPDMSDEETRKFYEDKRSKKDDHIL